ncbi:uncharacterized protein ISCGN_001879 [Ixodes scapularis]
MEASDEDKFLGTVDGDITKSSARARFVDLQINGCGVGAKVDTGAEVTVVSEYFPGRPKQLIKAKNLRGPNSESLTTLGKFQAVITSKGKSCEAPIYVVQNLRTPLVGLPTINALGIVRFMDEVAVTEVDYVAKYPKLFSGIGSISGEHTIRLVPYAVPVAVATPRKVPIPMRQAVKKELDSLEAEGILRKVSTPRAVTRRGDRGF